jgi:hypothetical protein
MKLRFVRVLSIGGVLAAATATAGYGQVFGGAPDPASATSSTTPGSGSGSTASSTATSVAASAPVTVVPAPVPGSATQFSYIAGDAATIVLDSADGTLRLVSFVPNPGWFTVRLDQVSVTDLDVRLESPSGQVRFTAGIVGGAIVANLEVGAAPGTSVPGNSAPGNSAPGNSTPGNSTPGNTTPGGGDDDDGDDNGAGDNGGDDNGGDDNSGPGGGGDDNSGSDD